MEVQNQPIGSTLPDVGPLGAVSNQRPPGTVLVRTCRISTGELRGLRSIWPRDELTTNQIRAIRQDLQSGGEVLIPVVVRCEPGHEDVPVDLIAGEHRVEAAFREGRSELTVQTLVCTRSEALLSLLRESAEPGTPRTMLEQAWGIERWIEDSGFEGTQRELSVMLGMGESQVSELRKFARTLPEKLVKTLSAAARVPLCEIAQTPRTVLRALAQHPSDKIDGLVLEALSNLKRDMPLVEAWHLALGTSKAPEANPSTSSTRLRSAAERCLAIWRCVLGGLLGAAESFARSLVTLLLIALRTVRRPLLLAKRHLDARVHSRTDCDGQASLQDADLQDADKESSPEASPREALDVPGRDAASPRTTKPARSRRKRSPGGDSHRENGPDSSEASPLKEAATGEAVTNGIPPKGPGRSPSGSRSAVVPKEAFSPS